MYFIFGVSHPKPQCLNMVIDYPGFLNALADKTLMAHPAGA